MLRKIITLAAFIFLMVATVRAQKDTFHLDKVYSLDTSGTISLQSDDAKVTIVGSNRNDVHITVDYKLDFDGFSLGGYEPFNMRVWTEKGNLHIKEEPREMDGMRVGVTNETYTVTIEAPKNANLMFSGDDENYKIKNINGEVHIKADDADITCTNCGGKLFAYRIEDGTITMNGGQGILKISADDGRATIKKGAFKQINLQADDGCFNITNNVQSSSNYQISLGDGSIKLNLAKNTFSKTVALDVSTDDGDISIQSNAQEGDKYSIAADDANITFNIIKGGATVSVYYNNAQISHDNSYQILSSMEGISKYRLNEGGADIKINVDDADIELH